MWDGMLEALMSPLSSCWNQLCVNDGNSSGSGASLGSFSREGKDGLLWLKDIGEYASGEFSMAVVQANQVLEDQSQSNCQSVGALQEAARMREMRWSDLKKIDKKVRRHFHDDITVIVLFLNHDLTSRGLVRSPLAVTIECPQALIFVLFIERKLSRVILDSGKSSRSSSTEKTAQLKWGEKRFSNLYNIVCLEESSVTVSEEEDRDDGADEKDAVPVIDQT